MARGFGAAERVSRASTKPPPVGPDAVSELGLPSLKGVTLSEFPSLHKLERDAFNKIDKEWNMPSGPERDAMLEKLFEWEEKGRKYRGYLEKQEREERRAAKGAAKAVKEKERNRVAGVAKGIITSLWPQERGLADAIYRGKDAELAKVKELIAKAEGRRENLTEMEEKFVQRSGFANLEVDRTGGFYEDAFGRERMRGKLSLDPVASDDERIREESDRIAKDNIESFANKLVVKTEETAGPGEEMVGAPIVRNSNTDPWADSIIEINTTNRKLVWSTKMIWNRSKLQNDFNQWPTRLLKNEDRK